MTTTFHCLTCHHAPETHEHDVDADLVSCCTSGCSCISTIADAKAYVLRSDAIFQMVHVEDPEYTEARVMAEVARDEMLVLIDAMQGLPSMMLDRLARRIVFENSEAIARHSAGCRMCGADWHNGVLNHTDDCVYERYLEHLGQA
jgi:hypothetical protein